MRFRKTLTLLMLAMGLVFALSAWARQKNVGPSGAGSRPNAVRPYVACAAAVPALSASAEQKPFTRDQVQGLVRDGLGDDSGAKLIEQRGIDFAPAKDFLQNLKAAGVSEVFLKALRAAKRPEPASAKKPLNQVQVFALLAGQVTSPRVAMLVKERGIDFEPQQDYLDEVRLGGGEDDLITALKSAKVTRPVTVDPAAQARQAELRQHVARGGGFLQKRKYAQAEQEYRAALQLDSQNDDVYVSLAYVLLQQRKWGDAASAAREALRLNPSNDTAHSNLGAALGNKGDWNGYIDEEREALRLNPENDAAHINLGLALGDKGDWDGDIAEEREALRLNPNNDTAHNNLGIALGKKGDWDGYIAEEREALRLNPNNDNAHVNLGAALGNKGDWDGEIAEEREALRLNPENDGAHINLGLALGNKGDRDAYIAEEREALRLNPNNDMAHSNLAIALGMKGDWDGMITESREALRLNPNNDMAHVGLGFALGNKGDWYGDIAEEREALRLNPSNDTAHTALGAALEKKGDWDGEIAEEREALRLNPNNGLAHAGLGGALEKKGDRAGALEEYRAAYALDPKNAQFKQAYERLWQALGGPSQPLSAPTEAARVDISGEWKSLKSGFTRRVRLEEGHAYVERLVTEEQSKLGVFQLCDLTTREGKYAGTCRGQFVTSWYDAWHGELRTRVCQSQARMEFTKYSPSPIEGRAEEHGQGVKWSDKDNSDCGKRFPLKWEDFVWIRPN